MIDTKQEIKKGDRVTVKPDNGTALKGKVLLLKPEITGVGLAVHLDGPFHIRGKDVETKELEVPGLPTGFVALLDEMPDGTYVDACTGVHCDVTKDEE